MRFLLVILAAIPLSAQIVVDTFRFSAGIATTKQVTVAVDLAYAMSMSH